MCSYFEVPLFGLTTDSLTNRKTINLDLNKLIPQDVLQRMADCKNEAEMFISKLQLTIVEGKFDSVKALNGI